MRGWRGCAASWQRAVSERRFCAVDVAPVHAEPDASSEQVTQALLGEPLAVGAERDGWARVTTAYDYPGWIAADVLSARAARGRGCRRPVTGIRSRRRAPTSARRTSGAG